MPLEAFLLAAPLMFYFLPAMLPIWRPFLIVWTVLGLVLAAYWVSGFYQTEPRGLGDAIDLFIRIVLTSGWLSAGLVQFVRARARTAGNEAYRHWLMVAFGACIVIVVAGFAAATI